MPEIFLDLRMSQSHRHRRFQISHFGSAIETLASEMIGTHVFPLDQSGNSVCQLDFASRPLFQFLQTFEYAGIENIPSDNCQCGRRSFRGRFLDNGIYKFQIGAIRGSIDDTILPCISAVYLLDSQYVSGFLFVQLNHLLENRWLVFPNCHEIIGQQNGKGFISDNRPCT